MTDTAEPADSPINVPLATTGNCWQLREIVYAHYTYDDKKPEGQRVSAKTRSRVVRGMDIERFVEHRLSLPDSLPEGDMRPWPEGDPEEDRPLNNYVSEPCWVVIELDRNVPWYFEPNQPGITTQFAYKDDNSDLMHVTPDGLRAGCLGPDDIDCRLIYFVVQRRTETMQHQKFLCHVIHKDKRLDDPDQIDPDIPNDGGRFPNKDWPPVEEAGADV